MTAIIERHQGKPMKTVRFSTMMVLLLMCWQSFSVQPATAGPTAWPEWTCATYPGSVDEAIAYFDTNGGPATLDADGDGIACNEVDNDLPDQVGAFPEWSCSTFPEGRDAAIDYYTTQGGPTSLDADRDGFPCETNGDDDVPECADFASRQDEAQTYFDDHGQPRNLDQDQDGQACMNAADGYFGSADEPPIEVQEDPEAATETPEIEEPARAVQLPNSGAGIQLQDPQVSPLLYAALSALMVIAVTFALRAARR